MAIDPFKVFNLYRGIISEVGDLENIESYTYNKISDDHYKFDFEDEVKGDVSFEKAPSNVFSLIEFPPIAQAEKANGIYMVGYSINDNDAQYEKSSIGVLYKCLKTVVEIIDNFIINHPKCIIVFFENTKKDKVGIGQKLPLYYKISHSNIPSNYRTGVIHSIDNNKGIYIGPIFKDYPKQK